jgi:hypothetical protein
MSMVTALIKIFGGFMLEILKDFHSEKYIDETVSEIKDILYELYGEQDGSSNYNYLMTAADSYLQSLGKEEQQHYAAFNPDTPYAGLQGKVFAIAYPDNIYDESTPTLQTVGSVLSRYFPSVNGIHILPERIMSHADVWPQDFLSFMPGENAVELIKNLQKSEILDNDRYINSTYQIMRESLTANLPEQVIAVLDRAFNSHFNDGGFSQATRAIVDPRFGTVEDIRTLTKDYSVMLDYVVNHVDIDSDVLESFKNGKNSGDAFIIISPEEYQTMKIDGSLYKTFRPRPFPLYTGMRRNAKTDSNMNKYLSGSGLEELDNRVLDFLSIYFKIDNNQGLTAEDKRIFLSFQDWLSEQNINSTDLFDDSDLQPDQKIFKPEIENLKYFLSLIDLSAAYAEVFNQNDDDIFGEKFYIYTTFSESQADINPLSKDGFKMIIDDLYHLLSSGHLAMMRMDAIKYLWKEKGRKNFNMDEGNKFINLIRKLMALTAPGVLPLDEINSPDPVVYEMSRGGAFAYLFGPVNSTITAFNEENLEPLKKYYELYKKEVPDNFVPFVMLSTHDGRSVQGLGVHRSDGHVSIRQFYNLKDIIEKQQGRTKYRSVPVGEISVDTFNKVIREADLLSFKEELLDLFSNSHQVSVGSSAQRESVTTYILKKNLLSRNSLIERIAEITGCKSETLTIMPSVDYFLDWIIEGKTIYELCATTRSSLKINGLNTEPLLEAKRLALAQGFVLTIGQSVPAIYFNDLLGIKNDLYGYKKSGKPRDLNRHKNYLPGMDLSNPADPFQDAYFPMINKILELRTSDNAFYPGSDSFEFLDLTDKLFLNHPYYKGDHSLIIGNISSKTIEYKLVLDSLSEIDNEWVKLKKDCSFTDKISGSKFLIDQQGMLKLKLSAYGMIWLK